MEVRRFANGHEWPIKAPLELCENLHDDAGLVLQGPPLKSSLEIVGPPLLITLQSFSCGTTSMACFFSLHTASCLAKHAIAPLLD